MPKKKRKAKKSIIKPVIPLPDQSAGEVKIIHDDKPAVNKGQMIYDMPEMPPIRSGKKRKDDHPDDEAKID